MMNILSGLVNFKMFIQKKPGKSKTLIWSLRSNVSYIVFGFNPNFRVN